MSEEFQKSENVECVPMEEYYGWKDDDLTTAYKELAIASIYHDTRELIDTTTYIEDVMTSDLVIDFSGDIWGSNSDFLGPNRFLVGLIKDRVAQLLATHQVSSDWDDQIGKDQIPHPMGRLDSQSDYQEAPEVGPH